MLRKVDPIKFLMTVAAVGVLLAAFYVATSIQRQHRMLGEAVQSTIPISAAQTAVALAQATHMLSAARNEPGSEGVAALRRSLENLKSTVETAVDGDFARFLTLDPRRKDLAVRLRSALDSLHPDAEQLQLPEVINALETNLEALEPEVIGLIAQASAYGANEVTNNQFRLEELYQKLEMLFGGLILFSISVGTMSLVQDNRLKVVDAELCAQNKRFEAAVNNMSQGLVFFDKEGRLIISNKRLAEQFNLDPALLVAGTHVDDMLRASNKGPTATPLSDEELIASRQKMAEAGGQSSTIREQADGRVFWVSQQPTDGGGWVITFDDITERRRAEARISYLAMHDAMTDLPNRVQFQDFLDSGIKMQRSAGTSRLPGQGFAVHLVDIDNFKSINDIYGHPVGDAFLSELARRMKSIVRRHDIVARLGGDEFVIMQQHLRGAEDAAKFATRVVSLLSEPVVVEGVTLNCGASIGISLAPEDGMDAKLLLKRADLALYRAKDNGKSTFSFYDASMDHNLESRRLLEQELRQAVGQNQLVVYYQPQLQILSGETTGFEALVRWVHPTRGMVPPLDFIPLAEETGLINAVGEWVLRTACLEASKWPEHLKIAVNISPVQVKCHNFVETVIGALSMSGLAAHRLELEITESIFLQEDERTFSALRELRGIGVKFAIDDFGTGYSSLSSLRRFPFDKLKIDRSFVKDVLTRQDSVQIIHAVIGLGRSLGINTTAEGVEMQAQLDLLRAEGCTEVQGFMFGKPMPAADLGPFLNAKMIAA